MAHAPAWHGEPYLANLNPGPHLFVDDFLIADGAELTRTTHQPDRLTEPVIGNDGGDSPVLYMKVDRDPQTGVFRAWYNNIAVFGPGPSHRYEVSHRYAESRDGIHWQRSVVLRTPHPGQEFSLFLVDEGSGAERYKLAVFSHPSKGMSVSHSADGITFQEYPGNPAIPASLDDTPVDSMDYRQVIADIVDGCWDPLRQEYLITCGVSENGYRGKAPRNFESRRRCVGVAHSKDFRRWEYPQTIVRPDTNNGYEEFYGAKPMVRGNLYLGFLRVLHDELTAIPEVPEAGIGWTEIITSRDGRNWTRSQDRFIDRSPVRGACDHAMAWFGDCVTVGDKEYIYYGGYAEGHKRGPRQMGLGFLRRNGFVSRDAGSKTGRLRTRPLIITGSELTLNAAVQGQLRVRVTDSQAHPLKGFDWQDCRPIHGDSVCHPLEWTGGPASAVSDRAVRLEFEMTATALYAVDCRP
jgi:hypothetical protein